MGEAREPILVEFRGPWPKSVRVWPFLSQVWSKSGHLLSIVGSCWPKSGQFRPIPGWAKLGRFRAKFGKLDPNSGPVWPILILGRFWLISGQSWPNSGKAWAIPGQVWPDLVGSRSNWSMLVEGVPEESVAQIQPAPIGVGCPNSARIRPTSGDVDQIWPKWGKLACTWGAPPLELRCDQFSLLGGLLFSRPCRRAANITRRTRCIICSRSPPPMPGVQPQLGEPHNNMAPKSGHMTEKWDTCHAACRAPV